MMLEQRTGGLLVVRSQLLFPEEREGREWLRPEMMVNQQVAAHYSTLQKMQEVGGAWELNLPRQHRSVVDPLGDVRLLGEPAG